MIDNVVVEDDDDVFVKGNCIISSKKVNEYDDSSLTNFMNGYDDSSSCLR